jgi:hypothetical protein
MATLAVFLVLGGGTALASYVISSNSQVGPNTISGHHVSTGTHANLIAGSVGSRDVADNNLTGADIANRSGVDTCQTPLTVKFGPICAGSDGGSRRWIDAMAYCTDLGLRLPSVGEGIELARNYDVPGVSGGDYFWTDDVSEDNTTNQARGINEDGVSEGFGIGGSEKTVCVTDPSA